MSWLLVVAVLAGFALGPSAGTDHIVGANHGWNPNINYSLWSGNQTFYVGDLISFRYQKGTHNVFEVNETGYDNCTMAGVAGNWTSGKDFIPFPEARRYYFICGNGFCLQGMKVAITVHPLPHNATSKGSNSRGSTGAQEEAATAALGARSAAWLATLAVAGAAVAAFS
ncbi:early nodulin-like protein 19 [Miscanthus floridulus]|uniref:early nodulin-like protein 19 n=1 Tax=Miscanthus floridulus TaxID=154761 RepID=UPI00345A3A8B